MRRVWILLLLCLPASAGAAQSDDEQVNFLPEDPNASDTSEQVNFLPEEPDSSETPEPESAPIPLRFEATLQGMLAVPFASESKPTAFGYAVTYGMGYGEFPFMFGVDFMSAGGDTAGNFAATGSDGEAMEFRKEAANKTLYFDAWLRLRPKSWAVRPYVEGFAGARLAQLRYSVNLVAAPSDTGTSGTDEHWTTSLGWGAGVDFAGLLHIGDALSVTLGMRRLHGPPTKFTLTGDIDGHQVTTGHQVAGSVTMFMAGITTWLDLGAD